MCKEKVYIFTHIPKTAGTSIRKHFQINLTNQIEFIHLTNRGNKQAKEKGLLPFIKRSVALRNTVKVILGHQVNELTKDLLKNKLPVEIVFFRHPVSWEISRYNQYANRIKKTKGLSIDFDFWLESSGKIHSQFDWFLLNYIKRNNGIKYLDKNQKFLLLSKTLENFTYVLFVEDLPSSIRPIFKLLNIPEEIHENKNVVGIDKPNLFKKNHKNMKKLEALCADDIVIYNKLYRQFGLKSA